MDRQEDKQFEKNLEKHGYKFHKQTLLSGAECLFQKTIENNEHLKLYFIDVEKFDLSKYNNTLNNSYVAVCHLYDVHGEAFKIERVIRTFDDLIQYEDYIAKMHKLLGSNIDPHNN